MKKLFALLLALALVFTIAACGSEKKTQEGLKNITVTVVHSDGTSKDFTSETDEEYLGPVLEEAGLIVGEEGPYGLVISEVDGETAVYETDGAYWALYEGDEYALQGIDTTPLTDGGVYKLVYTGA